jgi:hypothetical protein
VEAAAAEKLLLRQQQRIAALAAYLAICEGRATCQVTGQTDAWETDDGETWGGASPTAGTYGGSGWRLAVVSTAGEVLWSTAADRRAELAEWERPTTGTTVDTFHVPRVAWPLDPTWADAVLPEGWRLVVRLDRYGHVFDRRLVR